MTQDVKSGKEILDAFFESVLNIPNVDKEIAEILQNLHREGKISEKNIYNALLKHREEPSNGKN